MPTISDITDLKDWLGSRSARSAQTIALRAALRSLPALTSGFQATTGAIGEDLIFATLRANLIIWASATEEQSFHGHTESYAYGSLRKKFDKHQSIGLSDNVDAAAKATLDAACSAYAAARERYARSDAATYSPDVLAMNAKEYARSAVENAYYATSKNEFFWPSVSFDANFIDRSQSSIPSFIFESLPIWNRNSDKDRIGVPEENFLAIREFDRTARLIGHRWLSLVDWYSAICMGYAPWGLSRGSESELRKRVLAADEDFWERDAHNVNADIQMWISELRGNVADEPEAKRPIRKPEEPFVFLSYAHEDRDTVLRLADTLDDYGIRFWWDQDIATGDGWRDTIAQKLNECAAVLALWTEASCASSSVREEATKAQSSFKLVHARLDDTPLPYGYGETQYADLRQQDFTQDNSGFRRLVQALQDKLSPPSIGDVTRRLIESSNAEIDVGENGLVTSTTRPANVDPVADNDRAKTERCNAARFNAQQIIDDVQSGRHNIPPDAVAPLRHYVNELDGSSQWFLLDNHMADFRSQMKRHYVEDWEETLKDRSERLLNQHRGLEPYLSPEQPEIDPAEQMPSLNIGAVDAELMGTISETIQVVTEPETAQVLDLQTIEALRFMLQESEHAIDPDVDPAFGEREIDAKQAAKRTYLGRLAGFTAGITTAIGGGLAANALSSPVAAETLLTRLQPLLDALLKLFAG